jgi:hypothetical protein
LKSHNSTTYLISILSGALFFLFSHAYGVSKDSISVDTLTQEVSSERFTPKRKKPVDSLLVDQADTIGTDTAGIFEKKGRIPNPQRAIILSAVLPGLGQAYNHKYWKIPVLYSVGAGLYYYYYRQDYLYDLFRQRYDVAVGDEKDRYQDIYERASSRRTKAIIYMGILYVANVVDAMSDAYFLQYDISDDLKVNVAPTVIPGSFHASSGASLGISFNIYF